MLVSGLSIFVPVVTAFLSPGGREVRDALVLQA